MKKAIVIIVIVLAISVVGLTTGLSFAWFTSTEKMNSTITHQANSPSANVEVLDIAKTGTIAPAVPCVDDDGVPSYVSDPTGYQTYVAANGLLTADGTYIETGASPINITGKFKYEGKDDDGLEVGTRTLVVQLLAQNHETAQTIAYTNFCFNFEADDDNDSGTPAAIIKTDSDRETYTAGSTTYVGVDLISVNPAQLVTDWYWFTMTIYFSKIDDDMDASLNGIAIDFTMNIIAA